MALVDQRYTVRFPGPDLIVRGQDYLLTAPVYLDGATVQPTALPPPSVSVYDASNALIVTATPTYNVATERLEYTISSATTAGITTLELGWRVQWTIYLSGVGAPLTPRNDAALVRSGLWPVISDVDVNRRLPALNLANTGVIATASNWQGEIDEAWTQINLRLIRLGNRPNLIMEPSALRDAHLNLTLALIFEGRLASHLNEAYTSAARRYFQDYEKAFNELNPRYATYDDEQADSRRSPAQPTVWLSGSNRAGKYGGWWY